MILKLEYSLTNETYCQWLQLKYAIPWLQLKYAISQKWKTDTKQSPGNVSKLLIKGHHLKSLNLNTPKTIFLRITFNIDNIIYK